MRTLFFLAILIIGGIAGFLAKLALKGRMSNALGRDVKDHELNSISSWMKATENEERNNRPI
jgi:hypothetical protein